MNALKRAVQINRVCPYCDKIVPVTFELLSPHSTRKICDFCEKKSVLKPGIRYYFVMGILVFISCSFLFSKRIFGEWSTTGASAIILIVTLTIYSTIPYFSFLSKVD